MNNTDSGHFMCDYLNWLLLLMTRFSILGSCTPISLLVLQTNKHFPV